MRAASTVRAPRPGGASRCRNRGLVTDRAQPRRQPTAARSQRADVIRRREAEVSRSRRNCKFGPIDAGRVGRQPFSMSGFVARWPVRALARASDGTSPPDTAPCPDAARISRCAPCLGPCGILGRFAVPGAAALQREPMLALSAAPRATSGPLARSGRRRRTTFPVSETRWR